MPLETYNLGVTTTRKEIDRVFITLLWSLHRYLCNNWEGYHQICPRKSKVKKLFTNTGQISSRWVSAGFIYYRLHTDRFQRKNKQV